jgi:hypothetical protein
MTLADVQIIFYINIRANCACIDESRDMLFQTEVLFHNLYAEAEENNEKSHRG